MAANNKDNETPENMEIITLTDEDGENVEFEFLSMIAYAGNDYAVMVPTDEESDQVVIFQVEDADKDDNSFVPVTDQATANAVFTLFKEKYSDLYDFS